MLALKENKQGDFLLTSSYHYFYFLLCWREKRRGAFASFHFLKTIITWSLKEKNEEHLHLPLFTFLKRLLLRVEKKISQLLGE